MHHELRTLLRITVIESAGLTRVNFPALQPQKETVNRRDCGLLGLLSVPSEDSVPRANPQENLTFASISVLRFESLNLKLILQDGGRSLFLKRRRQTVLEVWEIRHKEK